MNFKFVFNLLFLLNNEIKENWESHIDDNKIIITSKILRNNSSINNSDIIKQ